jgi:inhibitor of KinA
VTHQQLRAHALGDSAVTISFGSEQSKELVDRIHAASDALRAADVEFVVDVVPSYLAITVFYDSLRATYSQMEKRLLTVCGKAASTRQPATAKREHLIRVVYDGADLSAVAEKIGLSVDRVIALHTARDYRVDILGFVPGFGYLSELDEAIRIPRRDQPRPRVKAGSVAIAASQTAIYPLDTPGGWHILGRTDAVMFDPARAEPALLRAGDTVRFEAV